MGLEHGSISLQISWTMDEVWTVAFSPDGTPLLVAVVPSVKLWDTHSGQERTLQDIKVGCT